MGKGLTLIYRDRRQETGDRKEPRFALIVSKSVDKRATIRNRIKRLLSESVRHVLLQITQPVDGVIIASRQLVGLEQAEVEKRVIELLKRAKVIDGTSNKRQAT